MSDQAVGIGMIGCGTVGGGVARLLREKAQRYAQRFGRHVELRRVLVRDVDKAVGDGHVDKALLTDDVQAFFQTEDMSVVVEVAGGIEPIGGYVRQAITSGRHVVTANKALLAQQGAPLFSLAREHGVSIAFEASCAGGVPCVGAIQFGLMANEIDGLYGILNGTCNYILTEMTQRGKSYAQALAEAQAKGFAEVDPTLDVSGADAGQKLAILASLAFGVRVAGEQVALEGIDRLEAADVGFGSELGYDIKLLAIAERRDGMVSVGVQPCFVPSDALIAQVVGSHNALAVHGDAVGTTMYYGAGAGRMPTASAVVSDVLNVVSGWYPAAFSQLRLTLDAHESAALMPAADLVSRFYLRVNALDTPGVMAQVTRILGDHGISLSAVLQHESAAGEFVPVVITTHDARQGAVHQAVAEICALSTIEGTPVVIRIVALQE